MKILFFTLGCKVNHYETQVLKEQFAQNGFQVVKDGEEAQIFVINSCTVTESGDKKTRKLLRSIRRQNPQGIIALTGCMPQAYPQLAEGIAEADVITGAANRSSLLKAVQKRLETGERVVNITPHEKSESFEPMNAIGTGERTRAEMKIQDGCTQFCAYCIIPTARGPLRSKDPNDMYTELLELAALGYKEVVLVGINLTLYGRERGSSLAQAVELACSVNGIERVRLGSIEPQLISVEDITRMAAQKKLCPQFHLALQSGCDETLARMNRHYTTKDFMHIVQLFRDNFENAAITTDIIVGFPGETEEEFAKTLDFVKKLGLAKAHVFCYSPRQGTAAVGMENQVPRDVAERRSRELIAAAEETRAEFYKAQIGTVAQVLVEAKKQPEYIVGHTANYTTVQIPCVDNRRGEVLPVRIIGVEKDVCLGELAE